MTYCYFELDLECGGVYVFWNIAFSQIFILIIGVLPVPSLFDNCREDNARVYLLLIHTHLPLGPISKCIVDYNCL